MPIEPPLYEGGAKKFPLPGLTEVRLRQTLGAAVGRVFEFIANSKDGVFAVDRHQTIVLWNEAAAEILGFRSKEVLGLKCYDLLRGRDAEGGVVCRRDCDNINAARSLELPPAREVVVQTKGGHQAWLSVSTVVVPSRRRELSVLIYLFRDVTRQHGVTAAARELADAVAGQEAKPTSQSLVASSTSGAQVKLTAREREILRHLMSGSSTEDIAKRLSISSRTVRNHVTNILAKLGVHSRLEAVTYSIENDLL